MITNFAWMPSINWLSRNIYTRIREAESELRDGHMTSSCGTTKSCVENIFSCFCDRMHIAKVPNYGFKNTLDNLIDLGYINNKTLARDLDDVRWRGNMDSHSTSTLSFNDAQRSLRTAAELIYYFVKQTRDVVLPAWSFEEYTLDKREIVEIVTTVTDTKAIEEARIQAIEEERKSSEIAIKRVTKEWKQYADSQKAEADKQKEEANHRAAIAEKKAVDAINKIAKIEQKARQAEQRNIEAEVEIQNQKAEADKQRAEAEKHKAEAEKRNAELKKLKAVAEDLDCETKRLDTEAKNQKARAEKQKAEAEKQKAEAEKQKAEAEKQKAEAEKQKAEAKKQKAKVDEQKEVIDQQYALIKQQMVEADKHTLETNKLKKQIAELKTKKPEVKTEIVEKIVTVVDTEQIDKLKKELAASACALAAQIQETKQLQEKHEQDVFNAKNKTEETISELKTQRRKEEELKDSAFYSSIANTILMSRFKKQ